MEMVSAAVSPRITEDGADCEKRTREKIARDRRKESGGRDRSV
jgi:hypothetical protein